MLKKIVVLGNPNAQKRHKHHKVGKFIGTYDPSETDKRNFLLSIQQQAPDVPYDFPLQIKIKSFFPRLKSHFGTGKNKDILKATAPIYHTSKPDPDNCIKFVLDSMNGIYWKDDSIICDVRIIKLYSEKPRTEIYIQSL